MAQYYPVIVPSANSLAGSSLGFHAYSLRLDNCTNQWFLEETSMAYIPPYSLGLCLRLYGTGVAILLNSAPIGQPQLAPIAGEQLVGVYSDQLRTEVAASPIRQFTLVQSVSDLTEGPQPALPAAGVDRLYSDTQGNIHHLHSNGTDLTLVDLSNGGTILYPSFDPHYQAMMNTSALGGDLTGTVANGHVNVQAASDINFAGGGQLWPLSPSTNAYIGANYLSVQNQLAAAGLNVSGTTNLAGVNLSNATATGTVAAANLTATSTLSAPVSGALTGNLPSPGLANGSVNTAQLVGGSVGTAQLANGSVTNAILAAPSVGQPNFLASARTYVVAQFVNTVTFSSSTTNTWLNTPMSVSYGFTSGVTILVILQIYSVFCGTAGGLIQVGLGVDGSVNVGLAYYNQANTAASAGSPVHVVWPLSLSTGTHTISTMLVGSTGTFGINNAGNSEIFLVQLT